MSVNVAISLISKDSFSAKTNETETGLLEEICYKFKIPNGTADYPLFPNSPTLIDKCEIFYIVADQDDLQLKITGPTNSVSGAGIKLKAGKPVLFQCNDDISGIVVTNSTAAPITGRFYAASSE